MGNGSRVGRRGGMCDQAETRLPEEEIIPRAQWNGCVLADGPQPMALTDLPVLRFGPIDHEDVSGHMNPLVRAESGGFFTVQL